MLANTQEIIHVQLNSHADLFFSGSYTGTGSACILILTWEVWPACE